VHLQCFCNSGFFALIPEDIAIVMDIIEKIKPHQVFVAGDLGDSHGTHEVCLNAIFA
jgi:glucosamine-6-phosphate deaminase